MPDTFTGSVLDSPADLQPEEEALPLIPSGQAPRLAQPAAPPPAALPLKPPLQLRAFGDAAATRQAIFANVLKAAQSLEPVSNQRFQLSLHDVDYADPDHVSLADQKRAILAGKPVGRRLRGTWKLTDLQDGREMASRKATLASVPYFTDRGTIIDNGVDYSMSHQLRLMPGSYTRQKANLELENHLNVLPGKGVSSRLFLDPESGIFRMQLGQAKLPLITVLKSMGVKDKQLHELWGSQLASDNLQHDDPKALNKLHARLLKYADQDGPPEGKATAIAQALQAMPLDPETTKRTLGRAHTHLTADALLDATKKLLAVSRGESDPDDRDELAFQTLVGPEDIIAERLHRAKYVMRPLLWKAAAAGHLDRIPAGAFNGLLRSAIIGSGLASPLEEVNAGELLDQQTRVTRMGEGGLPSMESVPADSRNVHPSQYGFIDYLRTPESSSAGLDLRLARNARKGNDGRIYTPLTDIKTGQQKYMSPQDLTNVTVALPSELESQDQFVSAFVNGRQRQVDRKHVQFNFPSAEDVFSPLGNMIPMKSASKGGRAVMAARMLTQAMPLVDAEAPLVQSGMSDNPDKSYEEDYGSHMGAIRADKPGRVLAVSPDSITVTEAGGGKREIELHNSFPMNRKSLYHQTPLVQPGDQYQPGQLLARSNYTDASGTTALGKNARVAYMSWGGLNYEDAVVVSESFAQRAKSEHAYQHRQDWAPEHSRGKNAFISSFPSVYDRKTLDKLDDNGVVKVGQTVNQGDPLVLAVKERERTQNQKLLGRRPSFADESQTWEHHEPGQVVDVHHDEKGATVVVKALMPMQVGDKVAGRMGDKGVVAQIVPDSELPTDAAGQPPEVLLNPLGLISRVNASQVIEAALGKIAAKTGKPYKVQDWKFRDDDEYVEWAREELRKHGMKDKEDLTDAATGRKIPGILVGNRFFMKLHHTSESKSAGRGLGSYTQDERPSKGGPAGAKRIGTMELSALLSHGGLQVVRDAKLHRGQAAPQQWAQFMAGHKMPTPEPSYVYRQFVARLKAAGINVKRNGSQTHLMAMTDKDVDELAGDRNLQNAETVDWREGLKGLPGGLFDQRLTGGHNSEQRWSALPLHEPLPSPVFEEPIRKILGLTTPKFEQIIAGNEQFRGQTGAAAIGQALQGLDLGKEIERARAEIKSGSMSARDAAVRRLGYLKDAQRLGLHPKDWMLKRVPVLPPLFRPVSTMGDKKLPLVDDANALYKELFDANRNWQELSGQLGEGAGEERLQTYKAFQAVTGLGDPLQPKNQERQVRGVLAHVLGNNPKTGMVQSRLLGTPVDLAGRATIVPNPNLDMDQVGIPENKAWEVYRPFIVRGLVKQGMPRVQAVRAAEDRSAAARKVMLQTMETRPVLINRAPTLHRYGMIAAWPQLVKGDAMHISPIITKGLGADFDGDAMQFHVPSTDEAAEEAAAKMLPSKNIFSVQNFKATSYLPQQEYVGGLYEATAGVDEKNRPLTFATTQDAIDAYRRGEIAVDRRVKIANHQ